MELAGVAVKQKDEPAQFEDQELGISLTAPAGWYLYKNPSPGAYKFMLQMMPPELQAWALFTGGEAGPLPMSVRQIAEGDVEVLKGYFKGYTVRAGSWQDLKVSRIPAVSYIADYQHKGKDMVEYRTYILGKSIVYWFVFRIEKDLFELSRPQLDLVINSLKTEARPEESERERGT